MRIIIQAILLFLFLKTTLATQRNILFILADDLGYNDVSWHNPEIISPHLHSLAMNGLRLENHYVLPLCTPSRAALMTGYYPIHTGRQFAVLWNQEPIGLYTNFTLMPEYFNRLGYRSHMVGKWHLGYCHEDYLPTNRGFHSFYGFYTAAENFYSKLTLSADGLDEGYDFRSNNDVDWSANSTYSTILYADRASQVISEHAINYPDQPLFLYLPFQSVHNPLEVPQKYIDFYPDIEDEKRRIFSGMVTAMDEAVGQVVDALKKSNMFENTIIIFSSDNGGSIDYGGNNLPLRGGKLSFYEGGTRVSTFIHASFLNNTRGKVHNGLMHISDWLPTLYSANGGDVNDLGEIDGIDQWDSISNAAVSPRTEMLYNIWPRDWIDQPGLDDTEWGPGAALRIDNMKLICGDGGSCGQTCDVLRSKSCAKEARKVSLAQSCMMNRLPIQLYDLATDPYEDHNLVDEQPEVVQTLLERLAEYEATMIPIHDADLVDEGHPDNFGGVFSPGWCQSEPVIHNSASISWKCTLSFFLLIACCLICSREYLN